MRVSKWQNFYFCMHYCFKHTCGLINRTLIFWQSRFTLCPPVLLLLFMMFLCSTCPPGRPCNPGLPSLPVLRLDRSELSDCRGGKNLVPIQQSVIGDTHGLLEAGTRALMGPAAAPGDFGERAGGGIQNASVTRRTVSSFHFFVTLLLKRQGVVVCNLSCLFVISCWMTAWFWIDW